MNDDDIERRLRAGESVDEIAQDIGGDVVDASDVDWGYTTLDVEGDCLVLPGWVADDGNAEVYYPHAESGEEAAQEYVADGDWGESESTDWVTVHAWQVVVALSTDCEYVTGAFGRDSHTVAVDPEEPECLEGEHEWASDHSVVGGCASNPGVFGSGGGVVITEHCRHCGTYRVIDTWAQNPETGEQGLRSVSYRDSDAASRIATTRTEELVEAAEAAIDEVAAAERQYGEDAQDAAECAQSELDDAREHLSAGRYADALACAKTASNLEIEYGDDLSAPVVEALAELVAWIDNGEVAS